MIIYLSDGNIYAKEIIMDSLENAPTKTSDNSIQDSCTTLKLHNIQPNSLSELDSDQLLCSPSRSESSYRHNQRVSGTTTPIHDHEIPELLIMDLDASRMKRESSNSSNDIRQYLSQETNPARVDKGKRKMYVEEYDESRERHNITNRYNRVQYNNSSFKNGTIDSWLKNCQTQNDDVSYTPTYDEHNFVQSPSRHNRRPSDASRNNYTDSPSHNSFRSGDSLISRDSLNRSPFQNNRRTEDPLLTPPNDKPTFRDAVIRKEIPAMHNNINQGVQSENDIIDSDLFVDDLVDNYEIVEDDVAESMRKRPRIDDDKEGVLVSETPRTDLSEFEDHDITKESSLNKDNVRSESKIDINSNQLYNDSIGSTSHQQMRRKDTGVRTIAIGQPTIDDLIKSGSINLSSGTNKNNNDVARNVNVQSQPGQNLKKRSTNDNRLALSLTDVLDQELKLKFDKLRILRRNKSASKLNQTGYSLSYFNKLNYGMWVITRKFNEKVVDIFMVHGERFDLFMISIYFPFEQF